MSVQGAGGTQGGTGKFFLGLIMFVAGTYLLLDAIQVNHHFSFGYALFPIGSFRVTSGLVLVPFLFGVGMIFFNARNYLGWLLAIASLVMLLFGVLASLDFRLRQMSALELLLIFMLLAGGLGLFLGSLRNGDR